MKYSRFHLPYYLLIAVVVIAAYYPSLSGGFLLDDHALIESNPFITTPQPITAYFQQEDGIIPGHNRKGVHTGYYRPLVNLSYKIDYLLWGMDPRGFRLTNVLLHILSCFLLFRFLWVVVKNPQTAFWATCLFALHPVNTEAVAWVSSRNNLLVTIFSLGSLYTYLTYCGDRKPVYLTASCGLFGLAVLSKEFGLMILPILFTYRLLFNGKGKRGSHRWVVFMPYLIIAVGYFFLRKSVTGSWITPSNAGDIFERLWFMPYILLWDIRLILFPVDCHSFIVGYPDRYLYLPALAGVGMLPALIWVTWRLRENRVVQFALLSFFLALFPVLNIFRSSSVTLISMRWLYFPMIFGALLLAGLTQRRLKNSSFMCRAILISISIYMGAYAYVLNQELWHDETGFYSVEVNRFNNAYYYGGWAETLFDRGDYRQAERYFKMAIAARPQTAQHYINFAALKLEESEPRIAREILEKAKPLSKSKREQMEWHHNLGVAYYKLGNIDAAIDQLKRAMALDSDMPMLWRNLGVGYVEAGDLQRGLNTIKKGLTRFPGSIDLKKILSILYVRVGQPEKAIAVLEGIDKEQWKKNDIEGIHRKARSKLDMR